MTSADQNNTQIGRFVCAARFYSQVLEDSIWIVLDYPFSPAIEGDYFATLTSLGLVRGRKPKWKIWPRPFTVPDGKAAFSLPDSADRQKLSENQNG
jgi:hypothetical protein